MATFAFPEAVKNLGSENRNLPERGIRLERISSDAREIGVEGYARRSGEERVSCCGRRARALRA